MKPHEWLERLRRMSRVSIVEMTPAEAGEIAAILTQYLPHEVQHPPVEPENKTHGAKTT